MVTAPQPTFFIAHGGGPWPFLDPARPGDPATFGPWAGLGAYLGGLATTLPQRPSVVVVISGHWQTEVPTVLAAPDPPLDYDYFGFPAHTYALRYPAPGSPDWARRVTTALRAADLPATADQSRGWDHGVFIPLMLIFPAADVPIVQLSLPTDAAPQHLLAIGRALAPLRQENALILASGLSYHNLREFFSQRPEATDASVAFDAWLTTAVVQDDPEARARSLSDWMHAPAAKTCHPTPEHLEPLLIAAGAAGASPPVRDFHDMILGKAVSGYRFG